MFDFKTKELEKEVGLTKEQEKQIDDAITEWICNMGYSYANVEFTDWCYEENDEGGEDKMLDGTVAYGVDGDWENYDDTCWNITKGVFVY